MNFEMRNRDRQLAGCLPSCECAELVEQFYNFWQPLEITNVVRGDAVTYEEVAENVQTMQRFVLEQLVTGNSKSLKSFTGRKPIAKAGSGKD